MDRQGVIDWQAGQTANTVAVELEMAEEISLAQQNQLAPVLRRSNPFCRSLSNCAVRSVAAAADGARCHPSAGARPSC